MKIVKIENYQTLQTSNPIISIKVKVQDIFPVHFSSLVNNISNNENIPLLFPCGLTCPLSFLCVDMDGTHSHGVQRLLLVSSFILFMYPGVFGWGKCPEDILIQMI